MLPRNMEVRGARVHNLKNIDVDIPLNTITAIAGATVIVIEHDLDVIRSADYIIDMGPGGGSEGGRIVVSGSPAEIRACSESLTARFIA